MKRPATSIGCTTVFPAKSVDSVCIFSKYEAPPCVVLQGACCTSKSTISENTNTKMNAPGLSVVFYRVLKKDFSTQQEINCPAAWLCPVRWCSHTVRLVHTHNVSECNLLSYKLEIVRLLIVFSLWLHALLKTKAPYHTKSETIQALRTYPPPPPPPKFTRMLLVYYRLPLAIYAPTSRHHPSKTENLNPSCIFVKDHETPLITPTVRYKNILNQCPDATYSNRQLKRRVRN